ncbi:hypothetical protein LMK05_05775 [Lactococcus petauri]|nr:hypothetical protein LMK05_05775 [Lactococcus petauri]
MQKSKKIIELEKKLAKEKAKEAKVAGFNLVVFDDADELSEIKVKPRELTAQSQTEILESSQEIYSNIDEIVSLAEKLEAGEGTNEDAFKLMFIIDEPLKTILSIFFDIDREKIATLPNADLLLAIVEGSEFMKIQDKTSKVSKEIDYISKNK